MGAGARRAPGRAGARADRAGFGRGSPDAAPPATAPPGLLVPGRGPTFSREEALDALERDPAPRAVPARWTFFVSLPRGRRPRVRRAGAGLDQRAGLPRPARCSSLTGRGFPGLVSIHDLEPTVEALEPRREAARSRHGAVDDVDCPARAARRAPRRRARDAGAGDAGARGDRRPLRAPRASCSARPSWRGPRCSRLRLALAVGARAQRPGGDRALDRRRRPRGDRRPRRARRWRRVTAGAARSG